MTFRALIGGAVALVMTATPAFAAAANPASSLSVASNVRSGAPVSKNSKLAGGGVVIAALIAAGVVAIGVVAGVRDSDNSDSN